MEERCFVDAAVQTLSFLERRSNARELTPATDQHPQVASATEPEPTLPLRDDQLPQAASAVAPALAPVRIISRVSLQQSAKTLVAKLFRDPEAQEILYDHLMEARESFAESFADDAHAVAWGVTLHAEVFKQIMGTN
jgi:hypothetical protein